MDCDECGDEIEEFAVCTDCVVRLRLQIERTPVELAAEELFNAVEDLLSVIERDSYFSSAGYPKIKVIRDIVNKVRTSNNQLLPKNPSEQDEHKSVL